MSIVAVVGLALVAAAVSILIKQYKPEYAMFISIGAGTVLLSIIIISSLPVIDEIKAISSKTGINSTYISILIKSLGICYVGQLACDTCKDAGENSLANKIEMAARISILVLALPIFEQVVEIITKLIG